jgi:hypothetical protein
LPFWCVFVDADLKKKRDLKERGEKALACSAAIKMNYLVIASQSLASFYDLFINKKLNLI